MKCFVENISCKNFLDMDRPSQLTNMMLALYNNIVSYGCKMSVNLLALYDDFKQQWSLLYRNVFYQDIWCG